MIDLVDEGFAGIEQRAHGRIAMMLGYFLAHPFPQPLDGIEVRTVAWER